MGTEFLYRTYMKIGYARISTEDQNLDLQIDALKKAGCGKIIKDKISGAKSKRPGLTQLFELIREDDTVVVWRLDRLGRSLKDLIETINKFDDQKVGFLSITENIDTTTPTGKLIYHIFGAFSEFERNLIRERTQAGLKAARARGRLGGRPTKLSCEKVNLLNKLYNDREQTVKEICNLFEISRPTLYKYLSN